MIVDLPGGGKSYMVECLARTLRIPHLRFNITQLLNRDSLVDCFEAIREEQDRGQHQPMLVFVDEINAKLDNQHVYDAFLEPLEDGSYTRQGRKFHLSPCMWIFAGTERPNQPGEDTKSDKGSDFESRLSGPILYLNRRRSGHQKAGEMVEDVHKKDPDRRKPDRPKRDELQELTEVEQVYVGVAAIRATYEEVNKVSEKVLRAFRILPPNVGPRGIMRFVRSFQYVQYSRVMDRNLPKEWYKEFDINHDLINQWENTEDSDDSLVEIRTRPDDAIPVLISARLQAQDAQG